ncbi:MAG: M20/M25/M40 family metallo-hydrolase [Gemmatimonadota bacterium]
MSTKTNRSSWGRGTTKPSSAHSFAFSAPLRWISRSAAIAMILTCAAWSSASAQHKQPVAPSVREAEQVLAPLVESYGVSGMEGPVRETVLRLLPEWARRQTETDTAGNLWLRLGKGAPTVVYIAHTDEIGFRVTAIREDGSLELEQRGGFFSSLYESRPALVHTTRGIVPGVFMPRDSTGASPRRTPPSLRVDVGTATRAATEALGVAIGSEITSPKSYARLAGTRATGRSFDDRVGCTALILAVRRLDPAHLRHAVIFIWSVREEIGLEGAEAAANALGATTTRVHGIDTFVSADSPVELPTFGVAPVGRGAVARSLDNSAVTPPALVDSLVAIARGRGIALQVGTTNGGNDGSAFAAYGVPDVAVGWPLRYSHSPAEVIDLKDVVSLAEIVRATVEAW